MPGAAALYMVIDQGGHASRAVLFDDEANIIHLHQAPIETRRFEGGRVEHDAEELIATTREAIDGACRELAGQAAAISRAGIATQRSSIVCWDRTTGEALSPVISWQDTRTSATIARYSPSRDRIHELTGLVLSPHYGATKIRWCLDNLEAVRKARHRNRLACGPLSSFILFRLLAESSFLVDPANASRTLLWNYHTGHFEPELLDLFGIPPGILPLSVPNRHAFGHLAAGSRQVPVTMVTGDQSAALYAFGTPRRDTTYINIGTGAFLQRPVDMQAVETGRLLGSIAWQSENETRFVLEGTVNGAGAALHHFAREEGFSETELHTGISRGLAAVHEPPLFLNGVSGLGSPFWAADFPSRFAGDGDRLERLAAVAESIVFLIAANLEEMNHLAGQTDSLVVTGGLAAIDGLCQRLSDLTGIAVERPQVEEATARGVAFLLSGVAVKEVSISRFKPGPGEGLKKRYRRWLAEMNKLLIAGA